MISGTSAFASTTLPTKTLEADEHTAQIDTGWGEDGFGFDDFLDIINPLQHIPFVSTLYREWTGDTIQPAAQILGGGILGGIPGIFSSGMQVVMAQEAGISADNALSLKEDAPKEAAKIASNTLETRSFTSRSDDYPTHSEARRINARMAYFQNS